MPVTATEVQAFCGLPALNDSRRPDSDSASTLPTACVGAVPGGEEASPRTLSPLARPPIVAPAVAAPVARLTVCSVAPALPASRRRLRS